MELTSFDLSENRIINIPTIGRCIYCGVQKAEALDGKLTDEHIIPFALSGNSLIFRKACCKLCQKEIHGPETRVLKSLLGRFREKIDAPTRNPKDRKPTQTLEFQPITSEGKFEGQPILREVLQQDAPTSFVSLEMPPPLILKEKAFEGRTPKPWKYVDQDTVDRLISEIRKDTGYTGHLAYKVGDINELDLLRFLAKVAHASAVAIYGFDSFKPFLANPLLHEVDQLRQYIGGWPPPAKSGEGEAIQLVLGVTPYDKPPLLAVFVRLYGMIGAPGFIVIVGTTDKTELVPVNHFG